MDRANARRRLVSMTDGAAEPVLEEHELEELLTDHQLADADGRAPDDTAWEPTFDLNRAAAAGWRRRAGKVAGDYPITADGRTLGRDKVAEAFLKMAEQYDAAGAGRLSMVNVAATRDVLGLAPEQVLNL